MEHVARARTAPHRATLSAAAFAASLIAGVALASVAEAGPKKRTSEATLGVSVRIVESCDIGLGRVDGRTRSNCASSISHIDRGGVMVGLGHAMGRVQESLQRLPAPLGRANRRVQLVTITF